MQDGLRMLGRRTVLRHGAVGVATAALGGAGLLRWAQPAGAAVSVALFINAGRVQMIDGVFVYVVGYGSTPTGVEVPGGVIRVAPGDLVTVTIKNNHNQPHDFVISGIVNSGPIAPGATRTVRFTAPRAGSYLYRDGLRGPVNQALGLHGALVVDGPRVPLPGLAPFVHEKFWVFHEIDPRFGELAQAGRPIDPRTFNPKYFTINGRSGILSVKDPRIAMEGMVGEPTLTHMVNAGQAPRSIHQHGNHFTVVRHPRAFLIGNRKDTVFFESGQAVDIYTPFVAPPDAYPPVARGQSYPVHDHIEMTQTANGGYYTSGLVTDFTLR